MGRLTPHKHAEGVSGRFTPCCQPRSREQRPGRGETPRRFCARLRRGRV